MQIKKTLTSGKNKKNACSYLGSRYYNPRESVWLSVDPMFEESPDMSPYAYCANNPVNAIDPNGQWYIKVSASPDRGKHPYAVYTVYDRHGKEVYKTVVKVRGIGGRNRSVLYADTPQGKFAIVGWIKTGDKKHPRERFGPNDLLALDYLGGEGGKRNGMHTHGGRQEGKYAGRTELMDTGGCMRINDDDIKEIKQITDYLERHDPLEKMEVLRQ